LRMGLGSPAAIAVAAQTWICGQILPNFIR
jgi:hypothetical protein